MVGAADTALKENRVPAENCGSDSVPVSGNVKLAITTISLPVGAAGSAYNQKVQASGGITPYSWSISIGLLPAGLSLDAGTGVITGIPKTVGTNSFTVRVTDSQKPAVCVAKTLSVTVNPPVLAITTASLPDGAVRTAYTQKFQATGGFFPYVWGISAGSLPAGLSLDAGTGVITGIPKTAGTSKFTVRVTDSQKPAVSVTANLSIKIDSSVLPNLWFSPI